MSLLLTNLEENQAQPHVVINANNALLMALAGTLYGYSLQTANYTVLKTDRVVAVSSTSTKTMTLPATTGAAAPEAGQAFLIADYSGALIEKSATVVVAVPSGKKLDGVTNGTLTIYGDNGFAYIIFVSDGTGYVTVESNGTLSSLDTVCNITQWLDSPTSHATNNVTLPTASNHTPGYIPFIPPFDCGIDQVIFPFGSVGPSSDATNSSIRLGFYNVDSSRLPNTLLWSTEDALVQGSGHLRSTSDVSFGNIGSLAVSLAAKTLSARRFFKGGQIYYLAYHLEPTYSAGTGCEVTRVSMGIQVRKLNAGAQAWPYTMANAPTVAVQFGGDTLSRLQFGFRYRRLK